MQAERLRIEAGRGGRQLFLKALRILRDEGLEDRVKVARAVERLQHWKGWGD